MAALFGEIFFDNRAQRLVGNGLERAMIAQGGQFLRERVRREQPDEGSRVIGIDTA